MQLVVASDDREGGATVSRSAASLFRVARSMYWAKVSGGRTIMTGQRFFLVVAAIFFLLLGAAGSYRLWSGYPITLGRHEIGHVSSYLVFVVCVGLSLALFRQAWRAR